MLIEECQRGMKIFHRNLLYLLVLTRRIQTSLQAKFGEGRDLQTNMHLEMATQIFIVM